MGKITGNERKKKNLVPSRIHKMNYQFAFDVFRTKIGVDLSFPSDVVSWIFLSVLYAVGLHEQAGFENDLFSIVLLEEALHAESPQKKRKGKSKKNRTSGAG